MTIGRIDINEKDLPKINALVIQIAEQLDAGTGAPVGAEYVTSTADATLTAERVITDTATITWDRTVPGQIKANTAAGGGNVSNSGTPTAGQYARWVTATTIQGVSPATVLSDIGAQPAGSYQPLDTTLTALAAFNTNGLLTQTAADTFTGRTLIAPAAGITVTNGNGVAGNPTLVLADDLGALEALAGTNTIYYRSAASTWTAVTIATTLSFTAGSLDRAALTGDVTAAAGSNATVFRNGIARSVVGVTGNAGATLADIQGTTDQVLRVNGAGTALAFGAIDLSKTAAATGVLQAASHPALTGDVTNTVGTLATTIANNVVTLAKMAQVATASFLGRITAATGNVEVLTGTQATTLLDVFTSSLQGLAPSSGGGTTNFLRADGAWAAPAGGGGGVTTVVTQVFTAGGTYTPTSGMKYCTIEVIGGGGGGGGLGSTSGTTIGAAGGGAGAYSRITASAATIGASKGVTIGTAGTAGSSGGGNGGPGGQTFVGASFATAVCAANGGSGGPGSSAGSYDGGAGGTITGAIGDAKSAGAPGTSGLQLSTGNFAIAGNGGSSVFGGGGLGRAAPSSASVAGVAASNYGSGGSGGVGENSATNRAGGAGSAGYAIITEYI